jgi:hypothetical protein
MSFKQLQCSHTREAIQIGFSNQEPASDCFPGLANRPHWMLSPIFAPASDAEQGILYALFNLTHLFLSIDSI